MFCIEPFIIIHSGKPYYMYMYDVDDVPSCNVSNFILNVQNANWYHDWKFVECDKVHMHFRI